MQTLITITNNWPAVMAFLVAAALAWIAFCKTLSLLFAMLAAIIQLFSPNLSTKVQWLSAFFSKLGFSAHDAFVHLGILKDPADQSPPTAKKPGVGTVISGAMLALGLALGISSLVVVCALVAGCLSQKEAKVVTDVAQEVACIFAHDGEAPVQVMAECQVQEEQIVVDVLASKHQAEEAKLKAAHCPGGM